MNPADGQRPRRGTARFFDGPPPRFFFSTEQRTVEKEGRGKDAAESELIVKDYSKTTNLGITLPLIIKLDLKK